MYLLSKSNIHLSHTYLLCLYETETWHAVHPALSVTFCMIWFIFPEFNNCYPDPCVNGTCMDGDNTYSCSCFDGYKGTNCERKPNLIVLLHFLSLSGSPYLSFNLLHVYLLNYFLNKLYLNCYSFVEINPECDLITCQNGGSCLFINEANTAVCVCTGIFNGEFCEGITLDIIEHSWICRISLNKIM